MSNNESCPFCRANGSLLTPTGHEELAQSIVSAVVHRDRLSALRRWPGQDGTNVSSHEMSLDVQATARSGNVSVQRLSSRLNVGKAIKTGLDYAHKPFRLIAFKQQSFGQICKEQRASTAKCAGPELTVSDRVNKSRFTLAPVAIKKDKGSLAFCADHCRLSSGAKIDNGVPIIRHVPSIRVAQRNSHSESSAFDVGERLGAILRRADRSFGCTLGDLNYERTRSRAPTERDECTQDAEKSLYRTLLFMGDDRRNSACHCVHRCDVEHSKVLINESGSV